MQITLTTRHLMQMLMAAYIAGSGEANTEIFTNNPTGRPEQACQSLLMTNLMIYNDSITQQT